MKNLIITLIPFLFYMILKYRKSVYMLQQNSYNVSNRYIKWTFKNITKSLLTYDLIGFVLILVVSIIEKKYIPYLIIYI